MSAASAIIANKTKPAKSFSATMTPVATKRNIFANIREGIDARMVGTITSGSKSKLDQFEADIRLMCEAPKYLEALRRIAFLRDAGDVGEVKLIVARELIEEMERIALDALGEGL